MSSKWFFAAFMILLFGTTAFAQDVLPPLVRDPGYEAAVQGGIGIPIDLSTVSGGYTFYLKDAYFDNVRVILSYEVHPIVNVPHVTAPSLFRYLDLELSSGDLTYTLRQNTMQNQADSLVGQAQFDHSLAFYDPDQEEFLPCIEDCPDTQPAWHENFTLRMDVRFEPHGLVTAEFPFTVPDRETYYDGLDLQPGLLYGIYGGSYFPSPEERFIANGIGAWWNFVRLDVMTSAVRVCFDVGTDSLVPRGYMQAGEFVVPLVVYKQYNRTSFETGEPYACADVVGYLPASAYTQPAIDIVVETLEYDGQTVIGPWQFFTGAP
jgi:hypothetical protein